MSAEQVFEPSFSPTRKNIISSVRADASSLTSTWLTVLGRCRPGKFLNRLFHRPLKKYNSPLSGRYLFSRLPLAYLSRAMSAEQVFEPTCLPTPKKYHPRPSGPIPLLSPPLGLPFSIHLPYTAPTALVPEATVYPVPTECPAELDAALASLDLQEPSA